ncbi:MAG: hypothetical protein A4S14_05840 [Proteobacteria bacterium SG_bin9]|nr:MAG: hypothetical protein A4S14_05840 [Proteobacteria bacterium SG_bin9]
MRYDEKHKSRTRQAILRGARDLAHASGLESLSVEPVMRRAGLTHGGFYNHFRSRADLIRATLDAELEQQVAACAKQLVRGPIGEFVEWYLTYEKTHRCALVAFASEASRLDKAGRSEFAGRVWQLCQVMEDALAARGVANPRKTALALIANLIGTLLLARALEPLAEAKSSVDQLIARLIKKP